MEFKDSSFYGARVAEAKRHKRWLSKEEFDNLSEQEFQDFQCSKSQQKNTYSNTTSNSTDHTPPIYKSSMHYKGINDGIKLIIIFAIIYYISTFLTLFRLQQFLHKFLS